MEYHVSDHPNIVQHSVGIVQLVQIALFKLPFLADLKTRDSIIVETFQIFFNKKRQMSPVAVQGLIWHRYDSKAGR